MMEVTPTRMELLRLRAKKKLAQKGQKLLKNKQDALIMHFFQKVKEWKKIQSELQGSMGPAFESLRFAFALDGYGNVRSSALVAPQDVELSTSMTNIMGVRIPSIKMVQKKAEQFVGSNQLLDAREKFKKALVVVTRLAEVENTVKKLAEELKKTKRMLNALEQRMIPELTDAIDYVKMALAETERENFFRLKIVKQRLENES